MGNRDGNAVPVFSFLFTKNIVNYSIYKLVCGACIAQLGGRPASLQSDKTTKKIVKLETVKQKNKKRL